MTLYPRQDTHTVVLILNFHPLEVVFRGINRKFTQGAYCYFNKYTKIRNNKIIKT